MLELFIEEREFYQSNTNKIITIPSCTLTLEHSLISLSKWESKWHIPYMSNSPKTEEQELDYIRCMVIGNIPNENVFKNLSHDNILKIKDYVDNKMTATTFSKTTNRSKKEIITAEKIYSRMCSNNIPIECQKWHLNRLLTLIRVCDLENGPRQKMSKKDSAAWVAEQNAARRAKYNTKG